MRDQSHRYENDLQERALLCMPTSLVRSLSVISGIAILLCAPIAGAQKYRLDPSSTDVQAMSELATADCAKGPTIEGTVVQRKFDENGLVPVSFVLEEVSGQRQLINVDIERIQRDSLSRLDQSWILNGLQKILRVGRSVRADVRACGAAGRVLLLDAVVPTSR